MLGAIAEVILATLLEVLVWLVLWPIVLAICTPFIVIRAIVVTVRSQQRFAHALADGYAAVSHFWKMWIV